MEVMEGNNNGMGGEGNARSSTGSRKKGNVRLSSNRLWLARRYEMHVCQVNAQRIFGPPIHMEPGRLPEEGAEIFFGHLPRYLDERHLFLFLEKTGSIYQLRLLMNFDGTHKGYGFVQYFSRDDAERAIGILHGAEIHNEDCLVACLVENRRLILGGVPTDKTAEQIFMQMEAIFDGVLSVHLTWSRLAYQPKGVTYIVFDSHRAAALARNVLLDKYRGVFWDHAITVDWAEPEIPTGYKEHVLGYQDVNLPFVLRQTFNQESFYGVQNRMHRLELAGLNILLDWMNPRFVPKTLEGMEEMLRRCHKQNRYMIQYQGSGVTTADSSTPPSIQFFRVNFVPTFSFFSAMTAFKYYPLNYEYRIRNIQSFLNNIFI